MVKDVNITSFKPVTEGGIFTLKSGDQWVGENKETRMLAVLINIVQELHGQV